MRSFRKTFAALFVLAAAEAAAARAPIADAALAEAEREGSARVIVRLAAPAAGPDETEAEREARRAAIEQAADTVLAVVGAPAHAEVRRYRALPLFALEANLAELAALAEAPGVLAIEADVARFPVLDKSVPHVGANATASAGWDGGGTAVAIVDTGVESSHPFFGGRVVAEACFSAGRDCPNGGRTQYGAGAAAPCDYGSLCYHGTHVAGIAAGSNVTFHGVAPAAEIVAIQIGSELTGTGCGDAGSPCVTLYDSDAIAALDYVAETLAGSWPVAAVNLSFGGSELYSSSAACDAANGAFKTAVDTLRALGIATAAAAGNDGSTAGIAAPGCISSAIGVSATDEDSEIVWSGSNTGEPLDLFAPGYAIYSSVLDGGYASRIGTSMAAPHVAGTVALLRQADPSASVSTLASALASTGVPAARGSFVRPRIQVDDAVRSRAPSACFDGLDNDGDGAVDVDGNGGAPDPDCANGFDTTEQTVVSGGCGIGPELALAAPLLAALRRRRRAR
jgi:subtilisin